MKKVYHGSIEIIEQPLVHIGRDNLDFGMGFYVTDVLKQAKTWAQIKSRYYLDATAIISYYLFDLAGLIDEERALGLLAMHQPNNQICILNQEVVDKYLKFEKSTKMKG